MANLLEQRDVGLRDRLGALPARPRGRHGRRVATLGRAASRPERSGGATSRRWPRRRASGLYDVIAHPDLVKVWGRRRPRPDGDLRRFYEPAVEAFAEAGVAVEVSTAGLRKPVGEIYPARAFLEMVARRRLPDRALQRRARARPARLTATSEALELLEDLGVREICVFERRRAPAGADRLMIRTGIGLDTHRFEPGRPLVLGGVEIPHEQGLAGHSDADVLDPRGHRRAARRRRAGRHRRALPRHRPALADADSLELLRGCVVRPAAAGDRARRRHGDDGAAEARAAPGRDPRVARRRARRRHAVNVKATTGEGMGFVGRGEGVAALAVATLEAIGPKALASRRAGGSARRARRGGRRPPRSCSCSTWRLSCWSERRRCPRTVGAASRSAIQPEMPEPATPYGERSSTRVRRPRRSRRRQRPRWSMPVTEVQARSRSARRTRRSRRGRRPRPSRRA